MESMYLSSSPGGFEQISFYDAIRGELYRDFADPIGMASRTLVEGLFGVNPNNLENTLVIKPGLPQKWDFASLKVPDISFDYKRSGNVDNYTIVPHFAKSLSLKLQLKARGDGIKSVTVNGKETVWVTPAREIGKFKETYVWYARLPELAERIKKLENAK